MRYALVGLILVTLGACGAEQATDPPLPLDDERLPPPPETGQSFHLSFDGSNDRVLVPWHESFPTEVFTAVARIRLPAPPSGRAAIIARGEDDNSFNLTWQLYVGREGELEAMLEASNEDNYCYPNNECVSFGTCVSGDRFVADGAWHHVALTRDASGTLVFYIDGEERARCEGTGIPSSNNRQFLSFGATHGTIGPPPGGIEPPIWFFPGEIDDPRCGTGVCPRWRSRACSRTASTWPRLSWRVIGASTKGRARTCTTAHRLGITATAAQTPEPIPPTRPGHSSPQP